jgi:hypothetical protein
MIQVFPIVLCFIFALAAGPNSLAQDNGNISVHVKELNNQAVAALKSGDGKTALKLWQNAYAQNPFDVAVISNLALLSYQTGEFQLARDFVGKLEFLRPKDDFYWPLLSRIEFEFRDWTKVHLLMQKRELKQAISAHLKLDLLDLRHWAQALKELDEKNEYHKVNQRLFRNQEHDWQDHFDYAYWNSWQEQDREEALKISWTHFHAGLRILGDNKNKVSLALKSDQLWNLNFEKIIEIADSGVIGADDIEVTLIHLKQLAAANNTFHESWARLLLVQNTPTHRQQAQTILENLHRENKLSITGTKALITLYEKDERKDLIGGLLQEYIHRSESEEFTDEARCQLIELHAGMKSLPFIYQNYLKLKDKENIEAKCFGHIGEALFALGRYQETLKLLEGKNNLLPSQVYLRARAQLYLGKKDEATQGFTFLLGLDSYRENAVEYLSKLNQVNKEHSVDRAPASRTIAPIIAPAKKGAE